MLLFFVSKDNFGLKCKLCVFSCHSLNDEKGDRQTWRRAQTSPWRFSARRFPTDIYRERERERERGRGQKRRDLSVLYRPRAERLPEVSKSRACVVILILDDSGNQNEDDDDDAGGGGDGNGD